MADAADQPPQDDDGQDADARTRLMEEVAEQMDAIEADFPDGYTIGRIITVVEVQSPDGNIEVRVRAGVYPWVALGLLDWAKKQVEVASRPDTPPSAPDDSED